MSVKAEEILNFLPIRRNEAEDEYISHLWGSFLILESSDKLTRPFLMMPFHLLFMLAIQNKVIRIYQEKGRDYNLSFTITNLRNDQKDILSPSSPYTVALLNESQIIDLLRLVDLEGADIKRAKALIRNRNDNLAHAKGGIERFPDLKIDEYIDVLIKIQKKIDKLNDKVAIEWFLKMNSEDNINDFIESKLIDIGLCRRDFMSGKLSLFPILSCQFQQGIDLDFDYLKNDEWFNFYLEGLERIPSQTKEELVRVARSSYNFERRLGAVKVLGEKGMLNNVLKTELLNNEKNVEIRRLLVNFVGI